MNRITWIGAFLFFFLGLQFQANATHITGAELTYQCINPNSWTYQVTLTVYRDCLNGQANFDNNVRLFVFRGSNNSLYTTRNINLNTNEIEIVPVYWDACTGVPYNLCIEYVTYVVNITLPPIQGGYNIGWARCCSNNVVTNIFNQQGITVTAKIPGTEVGGGCNSMPIFNAVPPTFLCNGQQFSFDHSATDVNGDSLVYSISNPYASINSFGQGATAFNPVVNNFNQMGPPPYQNINFLAGYSFLDPFGSGNFSMDDQSGLLTLTPTQTGLSVFAVSVREYRNGVFVSENKRDFQINVINCAPQGDEPILAANSPPNTNNNGDTVFVDPLEPFCYTVSVQDPEPTDTVILFPVSAAFGIGGTLPPPYATLTYTGTNPANGQVCWTPGCEYEGDTIRLVIGGRDTSDCPGYNIVYDTTYVVVRDVEPPVISHSLTGPSADTIFADPGENVCYSFTASDPESIDGVNVSGVDGPFSGVGGNPPFANISTNSTNGGNPVNGQVCWAVPCDLAGQTIRLVLQAEETGPCLYTDYDTVYITVAPPPPFNAGPNGVICLGEDAQLNASGGVSYAWTPTTGLSNPNIANPLASPAVTTTYFANITDALGCVWVDSATVTVNPLPMIDAGPDVVKCPGNPVQLTATGGIVYNWSPATGLSDPFSFNPTADPIDTVTYTLTGTDLNGCTNTDQVTVTPMYAVASADVAICIGDTVMISAFGGTGYSWDNGASLSDPNVANPMAFPTTTTDYIVTVTDGNGCMDTDTIRVTVNPLPLADAGADQPLCIGDTLQLTATGGTVYQWDIDPSLSATNISDPLAFPTASNTYYVSVTDANGCVNNDSVSITVNPLPIIDAGPDLVKCGDIGVLLSGSGGQTYQWTPALGLDDPSLANPTATPDSSTTYYVVGTDANGCQNIDSAFVRTMYADAGPDVPVCIFDSIQLNASGGITYVWDADPDLINPNGPDPIVFPIADKDFYVTVTDVSGCMDRDTITVTVNPLPTTSASGTDPWVCSGGATTFNATGGVQYDWFPGQFFADSTQNPATAFPQFLTASAAIDTTVRFYVWVTDANGCRNIDSLDQVIRKLPLLAVSNDTFHCPGDSVQLSAAGGVGYEWRPNIGLSDPNIANPYAIVDTTTTYEVEVTAVWGCSDSTEVLVYTINPQAGLDQVICAEDTIPLLATGGVSYLWDNAGSLSDPNVANPNAFPNLTTDFAVTVTDSVGCMDTDTVQVFVNPLPPANAGPDDEICIGDTALLTASGGISYEWLVTDSLSNALISNPLANPMLTTDYVVEVTDGNGCQETDTMQLVVHPLPLADVGPDLTKCGEDSIQLAATGGILYDWTPVTALSNPTIANPMAEPDSNITYIVRVEDVFGCVNFDTLNIQTMYANAGSPDTICFGDTTQLQASIIGGQAVSYAWSPANLVSDPNIANPMAFPTVPTDFIVTVTDSSGCSDTNIVEIFVHAPPPADAGQDTSICIFTSTQLTASGGISYIWTPADSLSDPLIANPIVNPLDTTVYFVTVTDTNGCTAVDSVVVTVDPLPVVDAGLDQVKCGEDSLQLLASGGEVYQWSPGIGLSDPDIFNPMASPDSNTLYTVVVTDSNACVNTDSMMVTTMYADAGPDLSKCPEDSSQLMASTIGGTAISFQWDNMNSLTDGSIADPFAFPTQTTQYIVTIQDVSGCVDQDTMELLVFAPPPANAGADTSICIFDNAFLFATGGIQYEWRPAATLNDANLRTPIANPLDNITYIVAVTDTNGCVAEDSMMVSINQLPIVDAGRDEQICRRDAVTLTATGATTYVWEPQQSLDNPFVFNPSASPDSTTTFYVTGTDNNQCRNRDSVTVNVWQLDSIIGNSSDSICLAQSIDLVVSGADRYLWNTGSVNPRIRVSPNEPSVYWVIPFEENGCPGDTFFIDLYVERNLPQAEFTASPEDGFYPLPVQFSNLSAYSSNYFWDFGNGETSMEENPLFTYNLPGEYTVTLVADNDIGCPSTREFSFINALDFEIYFPTAFSPNNDGNNDEYYIAMNSIQFFEIQILNRWGQRVYLSSDVNFRWDGTRDGQAVPEGVYTYIVTATTFKGDRVERAGTITLIR
ncbi:MAG: gliding motility-associated C-terminal domain-containing protein [Bacteroidota bacterium]